MNGALKAQKPIVQAYIAFKPNFTIKLPDEISNILMKNHHFIKSQA